MRNLYRKKLSWSMPLLGLLWLAGGASASAATPPATLPGPVVDTAWLAENLDNVVLLDVRKDVKSFEKKAKGARGPVNPCGPGGGKKAKAPINGNGHIEGAVLVNFKKTLGKYKHANGKTVKVMLPAKDKFEKLMQKAGVDNDSLVVITGKGEKMPDLAFATRLYWTLKYFGFDNAAILTGGTAQWKRDKQKVEYGKARKPEKGNFTAATERKEIRATMDGVAAMTKGDDDGWQLLDVRPKPFYLGLTYHRMWQAPESRGHIPTAKSFPIGLLVDPAGPAAALYSKEDMGKVAKLTGIDLTAPTVTTCHTGVSASIAWFVLSELLGNKNARLYDGSMHEWSMAGQPVSNPLK